mgnify:FL=1
MKKANKHYQAWPISECKQFLNMYLDNIKYRDESIVCSNIAEVLERTYDAIVLRTKEVTGILTNKERGIYNITPNMVQALNEVIEERNISKDKMLIWF